MIAFWLSPCLMFGERPNPGAAWLFGETPSVRQSPCGVAPMDGMGPWSRGLCSLGPVGQEMGVLPLRPRSRQLPYAEPCRDDVLRMKRWICSFWCELRFNQPGGLAWRDPPVLVGLGQGCQARRSLPPAPTASSPWALLPWEVAPADSWHSEVQPVPKSSSLRCWHLLQMVSAPLSPLHLSLAAHKGVTLQQQFAGWQGFDGTQ